MLTTATQTARIEVLGPAIDRADEILIGSLC